jgi:hypothetical protein
MRLSFASPRLFLLALHEGRLPGATSAAASAPAAAPVPAATPAPAAAPAPAPARARAPAHPSATAAATASAPAAGPTSGGAEPRAAGAPFHGVRRLGRQLRRPTSGKLFKVVATARVMLLSRDPEGLQRDQHPQRRHAHLFKQAF